MKILLLDDDRTVLRRLVLYLAAALPQGECTTACSEEAFEALPQREEYRIAFIEPQMGDGAGIRLAVRLQEEAPLCNVIFMTAGRQDAAELFQVRPSGFVKKPFNEQDILQELKGLRYPVTGLLRVYTFGSFVVYREHRELLTFSRNKSKEIFAYLIDQCGYPVTSTDIARDVWEQDGLDQQTSKNISKYVAFLQQDLSDAGYPDVIIKQNRSLQVNKSRIDCDLYHVLNGSTSALERFHGEYLQEYSWAEGTDSARQLRSLKQEALHRL